LIIYAAGYLEDSGPDNYFILGSTKTILAEWAEEDNIRIRRTFLEEQQDFKRHEFYSILRRSISDPTLSDPQCLTRFDLYHECQKSDENGDDYSNRINDEYLREQRILRHLGNYIKKERDSKEKFPIQKQQCVTRGTTILRGNTSEKSEVVTVPNASYNMLADNVLAAESKDNSNTTSTNRSTIPVLPDHDDDHPTNYSEQTETRVVRKPRTTRSGTSTTP